MKKILFVSSLLFISCCCHAYEVTAARRIFSNLQQQDAQQRAQQNQQAEQQFIASLQIPPGAQAPALIRYALLRKQGIMPSDADYQALCNEYVIYQQKTRQLAAMAVDVNDPNYATYIQYMVAIGMMLSHHQQFMGERKAQMILQQGMPASR